LTEYQYKGLLLEVATFLALRQLGIEPVPLHNPFDDGYAKDQHLKVDLIFVYNGRLFGVECKNLSNRSHVSLDFIEREIIERFANTDLPFYEKLIVFGVCNYNQVGIPKEYSVIELGYQVDLCNIEHAISSLAEYIKVKLEKPKLSSNSLDNPVDSSILLHGYKTNKQKLSRIDKKLKKK
jgi:hypothetical protein